MTGVVTKILKNEGDRVAEGETVLIIEAMKMENPISSPFSGVITTIPVKEGTRVSSGDPLFFVK
jgi:biotin carboxyl carrier protein